MTDTKGYIYFAIKTEDENLNLDDFDKYLTIKPTKFERKFERGQVPNSTIWEYSSGDLVNPYYFHEIEKLIEILEPHKDELKMLKAKYEDIHFVFEVVIFLGDETPGLNFSRRTMAFLNYIGAEIDCDIYNSK